MHLRVSELVLALIYLFIYFISLVFVCNMPEMSIVLLFFNIVIIRCVFVSTFTTTDPCLYFYQQFNLSCPVPLDGGDLLMG